MCSREFSERQPINRRGKSGYGGMAGNDGGMAATDSCSIRQLGPTAGLADEQAEQSRGRVAGSGLLICRSWLTICPCRGARIWPEVCVRHGAGEQSGKSPSERVTAYHVVAGVTLTLPKFLPCEAPPRVAAGRPQQARTTGSPSHAVVYAGERFPRRICHGLSSPSVASRRVPRP